LSPATASGPLAPGTAFGSRYHIYAFGLIIRDMLLGPRNIMGAETAVAELMSRMQVALPSARSVNPNVPEALDAIIGRCTEPSPGARYETTQQLVADVEGLDASGQRLGGTAATTAVPRSRAAIELPQRPAPSPSKAGLQRNLIAAAPAGISGGPRNICRGAD
jgi:serine/threonine-protein kinase